MVSTFRVELRATSLTARFALNILVDRQFRTTGTAKYCLLVPLTLPPDLDLVIGERGVAICARIVNTAAPHLDRNNVIWSVIMFATGLRIEIDTAHTWKTWSHGAS